MCLSNTFPGDGGRGSHTVRTLLQAITAFRIEPEKSKQCIYLEIQHNVS
jgi:hypothetical protein